ncbi:DUF805 domain-containing protein [Halomonas sp. V046]|uniref:DUF805 domain-containing protein n=1 Tax=Halomonas sp. V046 TaxID=3459611 RepID=UPI004044C527
MTTSSATAAPSSSTLSDAPFGAEQHLEAPSTTRHAAADNAGLWSTQGRIGRITYLVRTGIAVLIQFSAFALVAYAAYRAPAHQAQAYALALDVSQFVIGLPCIIFNLLQGKRRLNDQNRSGWLMLLFLIPIISLIPMFMMMFARGSEGDNRFGAQPAAPSANQMTTFWLILGAMLVLGVILGYAMA